MAALLTGLAAQDLSGVDAEVLSLVIVDNDAEGSAGEVVDGRRGSLPWPVTYEIEPRKGIATARNKAVGLAAPAQFVAFLDDDEIPEPRWLAELIGAQARTGADLVGGPVVPVFAEVAPKWISDAGFFDRRRYRNDAAITQIATNNLLLRTELTQVIDPLFDPRFDLSGGSDTFLSHRARAAGKSMVWADEAVVREVVPGSRMRLGWLLRRAYRVGNTEVRCLLKAVPDGGPTAGIRIGQAWLGFKWFVRRTIRALIRLMRNRRGRAVEELRWSFRGLGMIAAAMGRTYYEYGKPKRR